MKMDSIRKGGRKVNKKEIRGSLRRRSRPGTSTSIIWTETKKKARPAETKAAKGLQNGLTLLVISSKSPLKKEEMHKQKPEKTLKQRLFQPKDRK